MGEFKGNIDATDFHVAIVVSQYNDVVTGRLLNGARQCLREHKIEDEDVDLYWSPGALEIPAIAKRAWRMPQGGRPYDAIVCLGCVIRGETAHFQYVCDGCMSGIAEIALSGEVAVGNGVLTAENLDQALQRSGEGSTNKGYEATLAALQVASLFRQMR